MQRRTKIIHNQLNIKQIKKKRMKIFKKSRETMNMQTTMKNYEIEENHRKTMKMKKIMKII